MCFCFYISIPMAKLAVVKTGGKQYLVKSGDTIAVEKLAAAEGSFEMADVLLVTEEDGTGFTLGQPMLKSSVKVELVEQGRAKKIRVVHYKAKVRYHKVYGHRQPFTRFKVTIIV